MRTEYLEYLLDIYKTLSLTKTADNFYTSHQVINNAIKSLEKELNIIILNRSPKGVSFTDAGFMVCQFAYDILNRQKELYTSIAPFALIPDATLHGELDVNIIPRFSNKKFFQFYLNFCKKHKNAKISINTLPIQIFYSRLPAEKPFIFLVTLHPEFMESAAFKNRLIEHHLTYEIVSEQALGYCVSSQSKWLPFLTEMQNEDMPDVPFTVFNFAIDEYSTMLQENMQQFYSIDNFESQKELIKNGEYIGLCTPWEYNKFFQSKNDDLIFLPKISHEPSLFYYAVIFAESFIDYPLLRQIIKDLKNFFE